MRQYFRLIYFLLRRVNKWVHGAGSIQRGYLMISSRMTQEYRRMNSEAGSPFRQWLAINAVVGASLLTLIAIAAIFSDENTKPANTASNDNAIQAAATK